MTPTRLDRRTLLATLPFAAGAASAQPASSAIDDGFFLPVGKTEQWVRIRGEDRANPVLLLVHGGPGSSSSLLAWPYFQRLGWEKAFTVVHWDQQGAGKTFVKAGKKIDPGLTVEQIAKDGLEVAAAVAKRLGQRKVILVGGSWGTGVGLMMAHARPQLFHAYVGTAQVVNWRQGEVLSYGRLLAKARARQDQPAIDELTKAGPPSPPSRAAFTAQRKWANAYELPPATITQPELFQISGAKPAELQDWFEGLSASEAHFRGAAIDGPWTAFDARAIGRRFALPMFIFQGSEDDIAPASLAEAYVGWIQAPSKAYVGIDGGGHNIFIRDGRVLDLLTSRVRPLAR